MTARRDISTVLCFGDSNTFGAYDDDSPGRRPRHERWTGRLAARLADRAVIVEEGLNGRTTNFDYPDRPGCNGRVYFGPCLRSHDPVDVLILMLGTNDVKAEFDKSVDEVAAEVDGFFDEVDDAVGAYGIAAPRVVLASPAPVDERRERLDLDFDTGSAVKSRRLAGAFAAVARRRGALFVDAGSVAGVGADGIHLDAASHAALAELFAGVVEGLLR